MKKLIKFFFFLSVKIIGKINPQLATNLSYLFYKRMGMIFHGIPNYIASTVYFDGGNYSLIELGEGITISSNVSFLTHDWALNTIIKSMGIKSDKLIGRHKSIKVGDYSFIGRGSIVMPGAKIGKGCIIGAGCVVRGEIPDFSVVVGNPAIVVKDSREYTKKYIN